MTTLENTTQLLKALADPSRLRILSSLLEGSSYVEELAERVALQSSTVSHHLKKLELAQLVTKRKEQYYVVYSLKRETLKPKLIDLVKTAGDQRSAEAQRLDSYRRKVLDTFFQEGRLKQLPAQRKKRLIVLAAMAADFEQERGFSEIEVNEIIVRRYADYCTIRRELVDCHWFERQTVPGSTMTYHRTGDLPVEALPDPADSDIPTRPSLEERRRKTEWYKQTNRRAGVYAVRNKESGRLLLGSSRNLHGPLNRHLMELKIGSHRCAELQADWNSLGAEAFEFEVLAKLEVSLKGTELDGALRELERQWIADLQPFAQRCYNTNERIRTTTF